VKTTDFEEIADIVCCVACVVVGCFAFDAISVGCVVGFVVCGAVDVVSVTSVSGCFTTDAISIVCVSVCFSDDKEPSFVEVFAFS
jgi:hypothetical protein